jgi:mRNA interferase MazF
MTPFEFGDVILVRFPFTNQNDAKQRPAVVVSNRTYNDNMPDVIAMAITSVMDADSVAVMDWKAAGLLRESVFKPIFATFEQTLIRRRLGTLSERDQTALRTILRDALG